MKKILSIILTVSVISLSSCQKWLDINTDPNAVSSVGTQYGLVIPSIELNLITNNGLYAQMIGSYLAEHYAVKPEGPNTLHYAQWLTQDGSSLASTANRLYQYSYVRVINNSKAIRDAAAESESWGDYLAATVYRAIAYQTVADAFGEVPYTEAEKGSAAAAPHFDEGPTVYAGIVADLEEALSHIQGYEEVSENMLFNNSTKVDNFVKLANSILLRVLMRESGKVDVKDKLAALIAEDNFITADVAFASSLFANQAGQDNPLYEQFVRGAGNTSAGTTQDLAGHMAVIGTMSEVADARLAAKFNPSANDGVYEGGFIDTQYSIEKTSGWADKGSYSEPVLKYNSPVSVMTRAEVDFFLAEYYAKIAPDAAKAQAAYEAAIDASFATAGVTGAEDIYGAGKKYAWDASKAEELIGIQKWVHLANVNGYESWCELRRLGYPEFNSKTGAEIYTTWTGIAKSNSATPTTQELVDAGVYTYGTIVTPQSLADMASNTLLGCLPYPSSATKTNANAPKQKEKGAKVFWAK